MVFVNYSTWEENKCDLKDKSKPILLKYYEGTFHFGTLHYAFLSGPTITS